MRAETWRLKKLLSLEERLRQERGYEKIAGIDEAGRGPLAGPVVAAACILPRTDLLRGIDDSKKLDGQERYKLYERLIAEPNIAYGVGVVEPCEIDRINIHHATLKAMSIALARLPVRPDYILVDGKYLPAQQEIAGEAVVDGDRLVYCIAAASIIAKVTRDHIMMGYHELFPSYRFDTHKGYGTKTHLRAIELYGLCPIHRKSFGLWKN